MKTGPVRVAVLGLGNVGAALVSVLLDDAGGIEARSGVALQLAGVAVNDLTKTRAGVPAGLVTADAKALVEDPGVEVVVELIGGLEPARALVRSALSAGKAVVTANKELLAAEGAALSALAGQAGVDLLYEAAVAGAIPIIRPLRESLAGEPVRRVMGIVNGTTNFILSRMSESGLGYAQALAEAQQLGYAERDPTADVEGHDAAAKAAILASIAFRCDVHAEDVPREGIARVDPVDIAFAAQLGYVVKLLAVAERLDGADAGDGPPGAEISVRVHPAMLPKEHPLAAVRGAFNAVFVEGGRAGELMLYGRGAGGEPTASAVLGDVVDAARNVRSGVAGPALPVSPAHFHPADDLRSAWYLNIDVLDRPGVLAAVATVFGDHAVSIRSMEQLGMGDEARLVFLTHIARQGDVMACIDGLRSLDVVEHVGGMLRVLGDEEDRP
ncbi:MAG TPA: homoserine dehydrogenase [Acidimicrobiaceae bacterium]|nr:homoserine dehydrogenase [Acidimicrobiaceae bacterium]